MADDRHAGLVALPELSVLEVTGKDRAKFLHGMCTNDIQGLAPGAGCLAAFVTRQGKMVAAAAVHAAAESTLLTLHGSRLQPLVDHLSKFIVTDDVTMKDSGRKVLHLYGPGSTEILAVGDLADFNHCEEKDGVVVARNRTMAESGHDLLVPADQAESVTARLTAAGALARPDGELEAMRIASGFPRWGVDIDTDLLPMEAGLDDVAISYAKGCYIGQEVIQRVKTYSEPPRMLVSILFDGDAGAPVDTEVLFNDVPIGKVTSASGNAAMALIRKEQKHPGTRVTAAGLAGEVTRAPWRRRLAD